MSGPLIAFNMSSVLVEVLRRCGNDLTRERITRVATDLDIESPAYVPGVRIKTSPTDFRPVDQLQMMRFTGETWEWFGPVINDDADQIVVSRNQRTEPAWRTHCDDLVQRRNRSFIWHC